MIRLHVVDRLDPRPRCTSISLWVWWCYRVHQKLFQYLFDGHLDVVGIEAEKPCSPCCTTCTSGVASVISQISAGFKTTRLKLVFESPVPGLEKDQDWTGLGPVRTGNHRTA